MRLRLRTLIVALSVLTLPACDPGLAQRSHVVAHKPVERAFDEYMKRDLALYFKADGEPPTVEYSLLRDYPTQTGIAYPKYYAWVRAQWTAERVIEGAARIAAIDRELFEVTHFFPAEDIEKDPLEIYSVFPEPVSDRILEQLQLASADSEPPGGTQ